MKKEEFSFLSSNGKTNVYGIKWIPEDNMVGVICIAHGVTEHILRYEEFAKYFTERGIGVVGIDLLGHGKSIAEGMNPMYFGENGSWNFVVDDLDICQRLVREEYSDVPCCLLGFSLGSFLARTYVSKYPDAFNGLILVGTGQTPPLQIKLAQFVAKSEARKFGADQSSSMIRKLTFDTYNKKFQPNRTKFDWLCSNEESLDVFLRDPLRGEDLTSGLFYEMLSGMLLTGKDSTIQKMNKSVPVLFLSGENDPVGDSGKGVKKAYLSYKKNGIQDVEMKIYPNLRHDILHEINKEEVYQDIFCWVDKKVFNKR